MRLATRLGRVRRTLATAAAVIFTGALAAGTARAQQPIPNGARSVDGLWQTASDAALPDAQRRGDLNGQYAVVQLNRAGLDALLALTPLENDPAARTLAAIVITLPLPDGRFSRFRIEESPILAPELAAAFPSIRTYRGIGLDDLTASARLDITERGFHAQIIVAGGTVYVDPYADRDLLNHVSYDKASRNRTRLLADIVEDSTAEALRTYGQIPITNGSTLRTYRLALAATQEYTAAAGGSKALALARMTTSMNRVNGIYERDLAVRMTVATGTVADPTALIFTAEPDGYTNNNGVTMLTENQSKLDSVIGTGNYDIGHVFSTGGGGVASLSSVCSVSSKARGVTGLPNPVGDDFDVDFVAHEMGHQFGGNHTFNGTSSNCGGGNRTASRASEVGSGSTIQAYAGICTPEDLQPHSDDIFTYTSLDEMTAFLTSGGGSTCGTPTATGNTPPVVTVAGPVFTVPALTPFTLSGSATDANGDALTYLWEEHDFGTASSSVLTASTDDGSRPIFRSYTPTTSGSRTFPSLTYILNNANVPPQTYACSTGTCLTGEALPSTSRTMTFELTVRDNRAGGGGISTSQTQVMVDNTKGPFAITAPNTAVSWTSGTTQSVTWNVGGTNSLAANVKISLSTDGGLTFPTVLAANTPNDGTESIAVPNTPTTTARIKVEAIGNIFFDISNTNFTIAMGCSYTLGPPTSASYSAEAGGGTFTVTATTGCGWNVTNNNPAFLGITGASSGVGIGTAQTVTYTVGANAGTARTGTFTVSPFSGTFTINQAGCAYSILPTGETYGASGGNGSVNVTTTSACGWVVTGIPVWASTTSGGSGTGSGVWQYNVTANAGVARNATVLVAGQGFGLAQLAAGLNPKTMTAGTRSTFTLADNTAVNTSSIETVAGRSYCAEVGAAPAETSAASPAVTVLRGDNATVIGSGSTRVCFVASFSETTLIRVTQSNVAPRMHRLLVRETTLWANWYFVGTGYSSYTLLRNTSGAAVNVVITWRDGTGATVGAPVSTAIPAGGEVYYNAVGNAGASVFGSVEIARDGDPQAIIGSQTTLAPTTGLSFDTIAFPRIAW